MATTRDYTDYLNDQVDIAPVNSQEELQASEIVESLFVQHGLETQVEEFDAPVLAGLSTRIYLIVLFVGMLLSGFLGTPVSIVGLVLVAVSFVLIVLARNDNDLLSAVGPQARSQNVIGVHRATGPNVIKGNRPIVIVAHYDTPRENFLYNKQLAKWQPIIKRLAWPLSIAVLVLTLLQVIPFLPVIVRRVFWVLGVLAALPLLLLGASSVYERFAACTTGANDNKASVAAMLGVLDMVRPGPDDAKRWAESHPKSVRRSLEEELEDEIYGDEWEDEYEDEYADGESYAEEDLNPADEEPYPYEETADRYRYEGGEDYIDEPAAEDEVPAEEETYDSEEALPEEDYVEAEADEPAEGYDGAEDYLEDEYLSEEDYEAEADEPAGHAYMPLAAEDGYADEYGLKAPSTVRRGASVLESLQVLPETCEIVYENLIPRDEAIDRIEGVVAPDEEIEETDFAGSEALEHVKRVAGGVGKTLGGALFAARDWAQRVFDRIGELFVSVKERFGKDHNLPEIDKAGESSAMSGDYREYDEAPKGAYPSDDSQLEDDYLEDGEEEYLDDGYVDEFDDEGLNDEGSAAEGEPAEDGYGYDDGYPEDDGYSAADEYLEDDEYLSEEYVDESAGADLADGVNMDAPGSDIVAESIPAPAAAFVSDDYGEVADEYAEQPIEEASTDDSSDYALESSLPASYGFDDEDLTRQATEPSLEYGHDEGDISSESIEPSAEEDFGEQAATEDAAGFDAYVPEDKYRNNTESYDDFEDVPLADFELLDEYEEEFDDEDPAAPYDYDEDVRPYGQPEATAYEEGAGELSSDEPLGHQGEFNLSDQSTGQLPRVNVATTVSEEELAEQADIDAEADAEAAVASLWVPTDLTDEETALPDADMVGAVPAPAMPSDYIETDMEALTLDEPDGVGIHEEIQPEEVPVSSDAPEDLASPSNIYVDDTPQVSVAGAYEESPEPYAPVNSFDDQAEDFGPLDEPEADGFAPLYAGMPESHADNAPAEPEGIAYADVAETADFAPLDSSEYEETADFAGVMPEQTADFDRVVPEADDDFHLVEEDETVGFDRAYEDDQVAPRETIDADPWGPYLDVMDAEFEVLDDDIDEPGAAGVPVEVVDVPSMGLGYEIPGLTPTDELFGHEPIELGDTLDVAAFSDEAPEPATRAAEDFVATGDTDHQPLEVAVAEPVSADQDYRVAEEQLDDAAVDEIYESVVESTAVRASEPVVAEQDASSILHAMFATAPERMSIEPPRSTDILHEMFATRPSAMPEEPMATDAARDVEEPDDWAPAFVEWGVEAPAKSTVRGEAEVHAADMPVEELASVDAEEPEHGITEVQSNVIESSFEEPDDVDVFAEVESYPEPLDDAPVAACDTPEMLTGIEAEDANDDLSFDEPVEQLESTADIAAGADEPELEQVPAYEQDENERGWSRPESGWTVPAEEESADEYAADLPVDEHESTDVELDEESELHVIDGPEPEPADVREPEIAPYVDEAESIDELEEDGHEAAGVDEPEEHTYQDPYATQLMDGLMFSMEEDVSDEELADKDVTGLTTYSVEAEADVEDSLPATDNRIPKPRAVDDPDWGKSNFKPSTVSVGRRAMLLDLPDPSVISVDPLDVSNSGAIGRPSVANPQAGTTIARDEMAQRRLDALRRVPSPLDNPTISEPKPEPEPEPELAEEPVSPKPTEEASDLPRYNKGKNIGSRAPKKNPKRKMRFGHRRKESAEQVESMGEWLGLEDDYDAKKDGRQIGSWDNFDDDDNQRGKWKGGATYRAGLRDDYYDEADPMAGEPYYDDRDMTPEYAAEGEQTMDEQELNALDDESMTELREAVLRLGDDDLIAHDIWFVGVGASTLDHAGMRAFLDEHRRDIRGAFLVNIDSVGAGDLKVLTSEGMGNKRRADRRMVRMFSSIADALHIDLGRADYSWEETDATPAMQRSVRVNTLMGMSTDGVAAHSHTPIDEPEYLDDQQIANVADLIAELIRRS